MRAEKLALLLVACHPGRTSPRSDEELAWMIMIRESWQADQLQALHDTQQQQYIQEEPQREPIIDSVVEARGPK